MRQEGTCSVRAGPAPPPRTENAAAPQRMRAAPLRDIASTRPQLPRRAVRVHAAAARPAMSLSAEDAARAVDLFTLCENLKARAAWRASRAA